MEGSQYFGSQQSRICISLPSIDSSIGSRNLSANKEMCYLESSVVDSPSSLSSSSLEDAPPRQHEKDQIRSSGRNQLGRTYSPGLPLSMCEREEIVKLFQSGWKICDISKRLCVTHSCVSKILNRYRQTGSVRPKDAKEGRTESPLVAAVKDYRTRLGMSRQGEIREQLIKDGICTRETAPSRSSINQEKRKTSFYEPNWISKKEKNRNNFLSVLIGVMDEV
ncbi:paired box' domain protein [Dictyocaulus viviparus]|uniref:Paired box' domain protein n=1 Tax=Dictyocaulus viviparus TaxID=29172 RepID=A0A0D8XXS1_DICVI|nr:paired box' domain protein [Dictyocaulus viviparus]